MKIRRSTPSGFPIHSQVPSPAPCFLCRRGRIGGWRRPASLFGNKTSLLDRRRFGDIIQPWAATTAATKLPKSRRNLGASQSEAPRTLAGYYLQERTMINKISDGKMYKLSNCSVLIHLFHGQDCQLILTSIPVCRALRSSRHDSW